MKKDKLNSQLTKKFLKILEMIRDQNESDKDLANKIGVTPAYISQYKKGKREPNIDVISKICNYTKIPIKHFYPPK